MTKLARYLKNSAGMLVAIVALLFLQAYCDLTLPEYTSKIVNEGIQQKGIEDGVPDKMRAEMYDTLMIFLDEDGQKTLSESYEADKEVYQLKNDIKGEKREKEEVKEREIEKKKKERERGKTRIAKKK